MAKQASSGKHRRVVKNSAKTGKVSRTEARKAARKVVRKKTGS